MANWKDYKNKTYTLNESRRMDYELDLMHEFISDVYNDDSWTEKVKELLDRIDKNVRSKKQV